MTPAPSTPAPDWLWAVFTLLAAVLQTFRNAAQKGLTGVVGPAGAAHARFLYGLPFAALFFAMLAAWRDAGALSPGLWFLPMTAAGAGAQVAATAMMLDAMQSRSFVVVTAYTKCEPVLVAVAAWAVLGEPLGPAGLIAVAISTAGVLAMSFPAAAARAAGWGRPVLLGLGSGGLFALAAVFYRGAILDAGSGDFVIDASFTLLCALAMQAVAMSLWLWRRSPETMRRLLAEPRRALPPGLAGAAASELWFLAFALQNPAIVKTAALVEILFAQVAGRAAFQQRLTGREALGAALLTGGVAGALLM